MPMLIVDDWNRVTPTLLDDNLDSLRARPVDELRLSYWVDRIREKAREL
jgi:hypothetical protein